MVHSKQSKVYYIKMAGKIANLNLVSFTGYFLVKNTLILTKLVALFLKIVCISHRIQISYFSRHFYVVNFRLLGMDHFKPDFKSLIFFGNLMTNIFIKCLADLPKNDFIK